MKKRNNEKEIRLGVENWDRDAPISLNKGHDHSNRKIVTRGIVTSRDMGKAHQLDAENVLEEIQCLLREGYEYRLLDEDGNEALRLYPCVEKDMKTVFVAAQTMGDFRHSLSDKRVVPFVKGRLASKKEVKETLEASDRTRNRGIVAVTPDMMATCPACGKRFRVGKQLG